MEKGILRYFVHSFSLYKNWAVPSYTVSVIPFVVSSFQKDEFKSQYNIIQQTSYTYLSS